MQRFMIFSLVIIFFAWRTTAFAANEVAESGKIAVDYDFSRKPIPRWHGNTLVAKDASSGSAIEFSIFDINGLKVQTHLFQIAEAVYVTARDVARIADGTLGICGSLTDGNGRSASYIAFIRPLDGGTTLIRTAPFQPFRIAGSRDGTFWVAGYETTPPPADGAARRTLTEAVRKDVSVFRQFDKSGRLLRSSVLHSEFKDYLSLMHPTSVFVETNDRILWYSSKSGQLIMIFADGTFDQKKISVLHPDEIETGFAVTSTGEVLISTTGKSSWRLIELSTNSMIQKTLAVGPRGDRSRLPIIVLGCDENRILAFGGGTTGLRTFVRNSK